MNPILAVLSHGAAGDLVSAFGPAIALFLLIAPFLMMFGAALDLSSFDFAMKEYYTDDQVNELVFEDNPFYDWIPKDEEFYGDVLPIPVIYGNPQGGSASLANAITNQSPTKGTRFMLTHVRDYQTAKIDNLVLKASERDKGAFIEAATTEINGAMHQMGRRTAISLYGSGSGSIGRIASGQTTVTVTLTEISDVQNFEVGMVVATDTADGGGAINAGTQTLTAIDRIAGTLTGAVAWNDATRIPGIGANDYLFPQGDYDAKLKGLAGWLPATVTATSFLGVDRTADPVRLGGVRFDGSGLPVEEAFLEGLRRVEIFGGRPDAIFCNPAQFRQLEKSLGSRVVYNDPKNGGTMVVGTRSIVLSGGKGQAVDVIADVNCPNAVAYPLTRKTWKLRTLGKAPTLWETDSLKWRRGSTSDDVELWIYLYGNMSCNAPGWNGRITLTSTGGI